MNTIEQFEAALDRYAAEDCDMRDPERLRGLLEAYATRNGDCQLGCLLYQASRVISRMTTELHAA